MTDRRRAHPSLVGRTPTSRASTAPSAGGIAEADASRPVLEALRAVVRALRLAERATTDGLGLPPAQSQALRTLGERPAHSLAELAGRTHTDPSSASVVVTRLVALGLVARTAADGDRRRTELTLTPAGRARLRRGPAGAEARLREALSVLSAGQAAHLARHLGKVARALHRPATEEQPGAERVADTRVLRASRA